MLQRMAGLGHAASRGTSSRACSTVQPVDPAELSPGEFAHAVRRAVERPDGEPGARVVVIDSLNGYLNAMPEERFLSIQLHELLTYLGHQGVVTFLVVAQHGVLGAAMQTPLDTSYLADSVILFRYFEAQGEVRQALSVVKKRSGRHERTIREFRMGDDGHPGRRAAPQLPRGPQRDARRSSARRRPPTKAEPMSDRPTAGPRRAGPGPRPDGEGRRGEPRRSSPPPGSSASSAGPLDEVCDEIERGGGAALLTQEAILSDATGCLAGALAAQPPWSDFPLVVLTPAGPDSARAGRALEAIGHMTLVKRPVPIAGPRQHRPRRPSATAAASTRPRDYFVERERQAEALRQQRRAAPGDLRRARPSAWPARPRRGGSSKSTRPSARSPGITEDELLGPTLAPITHPDDRGRTPRPGRWMRSRRPARLRARVPVLRGTDGVALGQEQRLRDPRRRRRIPRTWSALTEDVTDRKQAEDARSESEDELRFALPRRPGWGVWDRRPRRPGRLTCTDACRRLTAGARGRRSRSATSSGRSTPTTATGSPARVAPVGRDGRATTRSSTGSPGRTASAALVPRPGPGVPRARRAAAPGGRH